MQNPRTVPERAVTDTSLSECRMEMLGLDPAGLGNTNPDALIEIFRNCARCDARNWCAADLKRDPNDPVWESYCPNAQAMVGLASKQWSS
jgi:hypothetical protein